MHRILLAYDGSPYSDAALQFAFRLFPGKNASLVGVFIQDLPLMYMPASFGLEPQPLDYSFEVMNQVMDEEVKGIEKHIARFRSQCEANGMPHEIHWDKGVPADAIVEESIYADLLLIGQKTYFSHNVDNGEEALLTDVLTDLQCPMLVLPENINEVKEVIFAYDREESSVWALRQFTWLFSETLAKLPFTLLEVRRPDPLDKLPDGMRSYLQTHYPQFTEERREGKPEEVVPAFCREREGSLLIIGSQHQGFLGRLFGTGHAKGILDHIERPVFVAYK